MCLLQVLKKIFWRYFYQIIIFYSKVAATRIFSDLLYFEIFEKEFKESELKFYLVIKIVLYDLFYKQINPSV